ncbi:MAG: aldehyde dehydrogenase family protein [Cyanobacteria bacterium REEB65]|nr:aldehyde dehydrogenase family protein [Cyanobacteria bacterium REEB65]
MPPVEPTLTIRNPATGEVLGQVPVAGPQEVAIAIGRARSAQQEWRCLSVAERGRRLIPFRKALARHAGRLAEQISHETGKPCHEALLMEVLPLIDLISFYSKRAAWILRPRVVRLHLFKHRRSSLHFVPKGVVGILSPWNFPLTIPTGEAVLALLAGNAVVLKPSELTPLIAVAVKRLWDGSGLPADLLQVVTGTAQTGQALVAGGIDHLSFTGSVATGRKVAAACGEQLVTCTLELGGKAPAIVCADADLERTAQALVWGGFANLGQVCASVERVYVARPAYESLLEKIVARVEALRQGDPTKEVDLGSMTLDRQLDVVRRQLEDALAKGATVVSGDPSLDGPFVRPVVLAGVTHGMAVMQEETFGPLLPVMAVDSEDEALELANSSSLGLNAYVFSRNVRRARRLAERIEAGTVMINDVLATYGSPETPWGGVKQSGIGRVHSEFGLLELVAVHHVNYPLFPVPRELWWFPYRKRLSNLTEAMIQRIFG